MLKPNSSCLNLEMCYGNWRVEHVKNFWGNPMIVVGINEPSAIRVEFIYLFSVIVQKVIRMIKRFFCILFFMITLKWQIRRRDVNFVICVYIELFKAWIATRRVSKEDWMEWVRRLSVELLKESPSPALRSCWALANIYNPLARYYSPAQVSNSSARRLFLRPLWVVIGIRKSIQLNFFVAPVLW